MTPTLHVAPMGSDFVVYRANKRTTSLPEDGEQEYRVILLSRWKQYIDLVGTAYSVRTYRVYSRMVSFFLQCKVVNKLLAVCEK